MAGWTDFFSHSDEGFLDEELDLDFEESAKEVLGALNFSCEECGKLYRTDRCLNRHQLNKHNRATSDLDLDSQIVIDKDVVLELVKQSQDKIYGDENYPLKFRSVIKNFQFIDGECDLLRGEIVNITQKTKKNNGELFYKLYFGSVFFWTEGTTRHPTCTNIN